MALPGFFTTTTLRTLASSTGAAEDQVRQLADAVAVELVVHENANVALAGRAFTELFARTFGAIRIVGPSVVVSQLEARARAINPAIDLGASDRRRLLVSLDPSVRGDIAYHGAGWWVGRDAAVEARPSQAPIGGTLAGVLAYNEVFRAGLEGVLQSLAPQKSSLTTFSVLDWTARDPRDEDLAPLPPLRSPTAALVGCGAIGHAFAFALQHGPPIDGAIDLVDPQALSQTNLQRYLGTVASDVDSRAQKVALCGRTLEPVFRKLRRHNIDWPGYRRRLRQQMEPETTPEIALVALDSAEDRRLVQGALPRVIINGWTRIAECGVTMHVFSDANQCLSCTYLPATSQKPAINDVNQLISELGLHAGRAVQLLAGASLDASDLRTIERQRGLVAGALENWRGESLRGLYGELCGMANIAVSERERYTVPLAQVSAIAGILLAGEFLKVAAGIGIDTRPVELSAIQGPGVSWKQPPRRKADHPARCVCKDPLYQAAYSAKWPLERADEAPTER